MICTITLNAGIDRVYQVTNFGVGRYHRPDRFRAATGGKGINVARLLKKLGHEVMVLGFAGGTAAPFMQRELARDNVLADFVRIAEESRRCISIVDPATRTTTQVDEPGPLVAPSETHALMRTLPQVLDRCDLLVLSGSAPRGVPFDIYAQIIEAARKHGKPSILDTRDEPLREGAKARPMMVKPNLAEFQQLVGKPVAGEDAIHAAARELVETGIDIVFVTLGAQGAIVATARDGDWVATPPKIDLVSAIGAGDAVVAGFAAALVEELPMPRAIARAIGAAAAVAATLGPTAARREDILRLSASAEVTRLGSS